MRSVIRISLWSLGLAALLIVLAHDAALALYLDENRNFALRARIYSQASIRTEDSQKDTYPEVKLGQLVQHRNFYNPELDANLTPYTRWLGRFAPDELSFRAAGWGFYDGIYDYGTSQFGRNLRRINRNYPTPSPDPTMRNAFFIAGDSFRCPRRADVSIFEDVCLEDGPGAAPSFQNLDDIFPGHDIQHPRDIYAHQERINELYLSFTQGPFFLRVGKQAISWGEADTIALLDQNNPFDITRGAPGAFQDLEEARIPLWTIRSTLELPLDSKWLSSGMLEAYWVPGAIDTNTGIFPILTASPYSPRGRDPQTIIQQFNGDYQFVLFDHLPKRKMSNSRFGFRFQSVIAGNHTFSAWYYNHFPNAPVPRSLGLARLAIPGSTRPTQTYTVEAVHKLTSVYGIADSFYIEPYEPVSRFVSDNPSFGWLIRMLSPWDAIWRFEAEYFENEPGFIPELNLGAREGVDALKQLEWVGTVPVADHLRWEVGSDRNIFFRGLNPTNSFLFVMSLIGSWNITETTDKDLDFRYQGQRTPGELGTRPDDFVQLKAVEVFGQMRLQTSYMHGRLDPAVTLIGNLRGTHAVIPEINYRATDWLLFGMRYIHVAGAYQQLGFYRDKDQVSFRATYQLN
ncbi:MAG TPA: DUF1302 family protein [Terriglobales bacterium]|nr:DUF1302 family protein [Terriglobales bacterium]